MIGRKPKQPTETKSASDPQSKAAKSASFLAAEMMLPENLQPILEQMVKEYQFAAFKHHGSKMVSPRVIAELILMGWRP
jgi:hypothetical protein